MTRYWIAVDERHKGLWLDKPPCHEAAAEYGIEWICIHSAASPVRGDAGTMPAARSVSAPSADRAISPERGLPTLNSAAEASQ
jgi:hypothetical protein